MWLMMMNYKRMMGARRNRSDKAAKRKTAKRKPAHEGNSCIMPFCNAVADRQSQAGAGFLGSEKRVAKQVNNLWRDK